MSSTVGEWSSTLYATNHNTAYSIHTKQRWFQAEHERRCTLVALTTADGFALRIPCFNNHDFPEIRKYIDYYRITLTDQLSNRFPTILRCCIREIACVFMEIIVMDVATTHHCPLSNTQRSCPVLLPNISSGLHVVLEIHLQDHAMEEVTRAIRDSFEEANEAKPKPATAGSVQKLLAAKILDECKRGDEYESGWSVFDHECVICTDEIQTRRSSLAMECSHVFHKDCLVRWLRISHVCPLCRYEMPYCV